jgi:hypothetical protein
MVASPVKMPLRPLPASITLVLSKPVASRDVPHPTARDCYGCVDWFLFDERTADPPQSTAKPLKTSGH